MADKVVLDWSDIAERYQCKERKARDIIQAIRHLIPNTVAPRGKVTTWELMAFEKEQESICMKGNKK